ncbi:ATP-binding cassette domain-containing protein [Maribacter algicola]|uniref:ATP-binding cassette domain-containing protein n=1 Tax=Meishania litoralis TaxID=3434685 RepID=A0ACC7LFE3_9FLAO
MNNKHWAIFTNNASKKNNFIASLLNGKVSSGFNELRNKKGSLFSKSVLEDYMRKEEQHGRKIITNTAQNLKTMSSGERQKALLAHVLENKPDYLILDNPFDNLDIDTQIELKRKLQNMRHEISLVQLISRKSDLLPFVNTFFKLEINDLVTVEKVSITKRLQEKKMFRNKIPPPLKPFDFGEKVLIELKNINVSYSERPILKNINWKIQKGDFWELRGKNGSGKTTILSMITGENPKGYGQELYIFGQKKGSGESVWDIKRRIGYFTPAMTDKFTGYHSVQNMVISGLTDSLGLYIRPTESQLRVAKDWLLLLGLWHLKDKLYHDLTIGQRRLIMCARAMIKHPVLLILDEPTAGLDDESAELFVALVNKFASESETAIVFVSHRQEPNLNPDFIYELKMGNEGSTGSVH